MQAMPLCRLRRDETDGRRQQSGQFSGNGADIAAHTVIMDGLRTLTPDIRSFLKKILPVGKSVSTGSVLAGRPAGWY